MPDNPSDQDNPFSDAARASDPPNDAQGRGQSKRDVLRNMHEPESTQAAPADAWPQYDNEVAPPTQPPLSATDNPPRWTPEEPSPSQYDSAGASGGASGTASRSSFDLERLIAGKWFAVLGSLCVVVSAGLFLKLAADRGWLAGIPPAARCIGVAAVGLALVALGELIRRKVNSLAASGVSAAGVATTYCAVLAAWGHFDILDANIAFVLLGLVVAMGIAVATASGLPFVAVTAIAGGFLAPFLLSGPEWSPAIVPFYSLALLIGALLTAAVHGERHGRGGFLWVGFAGAVGAAVLGSWWMWRLWQFGAAANATADLKVSVLVLALGYVLAAWLLSHATLTLKPSRAWAGGISKPSGEFAAGASMLLTAWACVAGTWAVGQYVRPPHVGHSVWPLLLAVCCFGMSAALAGGTQQLRRFKSIDNLFARGLFYQAVLLVVVSIALAISGPMVFYVVLATGVMLMVLSSRATSPWLTVGGLSLIGLAASICVWQLAHGRAGAGEQLVGMLGYEITRAHIRGIVLAAATIAAGLMLMQRSAFVRSTNATASLAIENAGAALIDLARLVTAAGVVIAFLAIVPSPYRLNGFVLAWSALGLALAVTDRWQPTLSLRTPVVVLIVPTTALWLVSALASVFNLSGPTGADAIPFVSVPTIAGMMIAVSMMLIRAQFRRGPDPRGTGMVAARMALYIGASVGFIALSIEAYRSAGIIGGESVAGAGLSVAWGIASVIGVAWGLRRAVPAARHFGLGLLLATLGKVVLIDLSSIDGIWRVLAFMVTGVAMLGIAVVYGRLQRAAQAGQAEQAGPTSQNAERSETSAGTSSMV